MQYDYLATLQPYSNGLGAGLYSLYNRAIPVMRCMHRFFILLNLFGALFFVSAVSCAQERPRSGIAPHPQAHIKSVTAPAAQYRVEIDAPKAIRSLLKAHLDIVRFATRTDMTNGQFDFLVTASSSQIADLLKAQGYFTPDIRIFVQSSSSAGFWNWARPSEKKGKVVSIYVRPGEPIRVKKVILSFQGPILAERLKHEAQEKKTAVQTSTAKAPAFKQQDRESAVRHAWPLQRGDIFTQRAWDEAKALALKTLQAERYLGAKIIASQALIDPNRHRAYLELTLDSGPPFVLGPVELTDLKRYPEQIIHHVNPLQVGEPYRAERVLELQRRIQNTPYFATVVVDVSAEPEPVPLLENAATTDTSESKQNIPSTHTPTRTVAGTAAQKQEDTSTRAVPVKVKLTEYPYHSIRFGVGYTSDQGPHAQGQYSYNNMFNRAWVLDTHGQWNPHQQSTGFQLSTPPDAQAYVYSVLGNYSHSDLENTDIRSLRTGVQRVRLQSRYEYTYSLLFYGDRLQQDSAPSTWSRALVPGWSWLRRDVDDLLFPREGNLLFFSANGALKKVLTNESFGRAYFNGRQYVPLGRSGIAIFRLELGGVFTAGSSVEIPASLLFRAGGSNSIRGYSYQSIGNHVGDSVLPVKYLAIGSTEYQHWFNHDWGMAAFYDVGTAADTWAERMLYQGVGLGGRWRSPVGPINFDVAYGLRNHSIRPYITLGIAF